MHANLILALAQAALVTVVPGPGDSCPTSAQVQSALEIHAPRLVTPRPEDDAASQLSLILSLASPGRDMSLSLLDATGRVRLYRMLPPPAGDRARDCAALADTVAFIVDRYFDEVELPSLPERKPPPAAPPPLPPPSPAPATGSASSSSSSVESPALKRESPSFTMSAIAGRRVPGSAADLGGIEFKLSLGAEFTDVGSHGGRLWGEVSGGIIGIVNQTWDYGGTQSGNASAVRYGGDLALLLGRPAGHGKLYAGPLLAVELIWLDSNSNGRTQHEFQMGSAAGLRAGYQYFWKERFFARADLTGAMALVRQEIATQSRRNTPIFAAPPAYATLSFGAGIWF